MDRAVKPVLRRRSLIVVWPLLTALIGTSCERVPLFAPSGSTISLITNATVLPVNGSTEIIAQIIEPAGTPPHSGTHVSFLTTLGSLAPAEAETDINGRAIVKFLAGTSSGVANITASSGGSGTSGALKISVGAAAVGRVTVSASPASVPSLGGTSTITANVFDINGNALGSAPVSFTSTAGTLSTNLATTNSAGVATTELSTSQQATVTATVGAQGSTDGGGTGTGGGTGGGTTTPTPSGQASGSVIVTVTTGPTLVITPPSTPPSAGLPAVFTFAVTLAQNGASVRNVSVDWGDGSRQSLGAVTGNAVVSHVYDDAGTFVVTGTVTDAAGNTSSVSTSVTVISAPLPTIIVTPTPQTVSGGGTVSFTINIGVPSGLAIENVTINFGDGTSQSLGGFSGIVTVTHSYPAGVKNYTVTVNVTDSTGKTTQGSTVVSVTL